MKKFILFTAILFIQCEIKAQNFTFNFNTSGRRVCLVSSKVDLNNVTVKLIFHDSLSNTNEPMFVYRRLSGTHTWTNIAANLSAGIGHWIDNNVNLGEVWEYQVKRQNTWTFAGNTYDATGYTMGALLNDNSDYKGQMILLVADNIPTQLNVKYNRLKKELTSDGWFVNELIVPRATNWDSGNEVVNIKNQIQNTYNKSPAYDKPKALFILGHVPMPRCGSTNVVAPDDHSQNTGARGCDGYYADIDGMFTDTATYNPGGLSTTLAINLPGDFKLDQDFFPSDVEMAFGRIDFADLTEINSSETILTGNYLDRLSNYKNLTTGFDMGEKSAFYLGYNNSNDGSYRSLINISKPENVFQKTDNSNHNQWVQNNGPFKIYMQNVTLPDITDWQNYGMNATVYTSDQSYWGFGDVPQPSGVYSRIRTLLGIESKCLVALWTTTGINIFHQACNGQTIGIAMKDIINHNSTNQYLEKPPQQYDTQDWWNRTHFEIWGDPTLNLFQVKPITNLALNEVSGNAVLTWDASLDTNIIGYTVYESNDEFGIFNRIISNPILANTFTIPNYQFGNWYMVKVVKKIESGCGQFLHPSLGISVEADLTLGIGEQSGQNAINVYPIPVTDVFYIKSDLHFSDVKVISPNGTIVYNENVLHSDIKIDLKNESSGIYIIELQTSDGIKYLKKLIKSK